VVPPSILVADDQPHVIEALRLLLKPAGYRIDTADSPAGVLATLQRQSYDVVVMDLNYARDTTSGREGLDLIRAIRTGDDLTPLIVMTAWSNVPLAVEAMQYGACDFIQKPWENDRLLSIIRTQTALGRARRHAAAVEARQRQDLELAAQVQRQLLPQHCPAFATLDCSARCTPAGSVGGDYFDFISLDEDRTALAVGDVAGKGVAAALLMTSLQALLRSHTAVCGDDLSQLIDDTNQRLIETIPANKYATLFYAVYSEATRSLTYVNAGHNPPLLIRTAGCVERLTEGGPIVGLFPGAVYRSGRVSLTSGDRLVVYTDGVTEAVNHFDEEFGEDRLRMAATDRAVSNADSLHAEIMAAHIAFVGDAPARDDLTLLVAIAR
jgi:phosphoserine phosphatase RsbU/P